VLREHVLLETRLALRAARVYALILLLVLSPASALLTKGAHGSLRVLIWLSVPLLLGLIASESTAREARQGALGFRQRLPGSLVTMLAAKLIALLVTAGTLAFCVCIAMALGAQFRGEAALVSWAHLPALAMSSAAFGCVVAMLAVWLGASSLLVSSAVLVAGIALQPVAIEHVMLPWATPDTLVQASLATLALLVSGGAALAARSFARFGVVRSGVVVAPAFVLIAGGVSFAVAPAIRSWDRLDPEAELQIYDVRISPDQRMAWCVLLDTQREHIYRVRIDLLRKCYYQVDEPTAPESYARGASARSGIRAPSTHGEEVPFLSAELHLVRHRWDGASPEILFPCRFIEEDER
jgi:hypothetical protein